MKKDIEWLKGLINEEGIVVDTYMLGRIDGQYWENENIKINKGRLFYLIDQLDKPETLSIDKEQLIKSIENYNTLYDENVEDVVEGILETVKQLPEMRVLSQKWIDEHRESTFDLDEDLDEDFETVFVRVRNLQNLLVPTLSEMETVEITEELVLDWLDNNDFYDHITAETVLENAVDKGELGYYGTKYSVVEKPIIPRFIAEVIEEDKEAGCDVYDSIYLIIETNGGGVPAISDWVAINIDKYARAWLDGFTVEEEQLFYVVGKDNTAILSKGIDGNPYPREGVFSDYFVGHEDYMLTEQEIKDYDPRYMTFAKPIEEFEE